MCERKLENKKCRFFLAKNLKFTACVMFFFFGFLERWEKVVLEIRKDMIVFGEGRCDNGCVTCELFDFWLICCDSEFFSGSH